jgi:tetratricopeptide (TPR) repeat protein
MFVSGCQIRPVETQAPIQMTVEVPNNADSYLKRGDAYANAENWEEAITQYDQAILINPDFAEAYNNRGYSYYWKGDATQAIADYNRAIELRPNYAFAYNNRGAAYMASGHPDQAILDFDQAIRLQPDFPQAYTNRGNAYLRNGRLDLAFADFRRAGQNPVGRWVMFRGILVLLSALGAYRLLLRLRKVPLKDEPRQDHKDA